MLHFELVSPERLLLSEEVQEVSVPGTEGTFTVLPNHAPVLSTVRPGVVEVVRSDGARVRIFVRGGFAEVNPKGLTLLGRSGDPARRAFPDVLAQQVRDAEEDVADAGDDEKRRRAQETLEHLKALQGAL